MKIRKPRLPAVPQSQEADEVTAARAIAAAVNQGLPGGQFARLINMMNPEPVRIAAGMTGEELQEWFKANQAARYILNTVPAFPQFCVEFLVIAKELYPNAPRFVPGGGPQ